MIAWIKWINPINNKFIRSNSCSADNSLGRARQHVEVSGRPGPATFKSPPLSRAPHAYNLSFQLDSYPPLDELRLLYRQLMVSYLST